MLHFQSHSELSQKWNYTTFALNHSFGISSSYSVKNSTYLRKEICNPRRFSRVQNEPKLKNEVWCYKSLIYFVHCLVYPRCQLSWKNTNYQVEAMWDQYAKAWFLQHNRFPRQFTKQNCSIHSAEQFAKI